MNKMLDTLNWRFATKIFDPTKKLSKETVATLLEAARLAPSTLGLQPWKFVIVKSSELRKQLRAFAKNQPQITDASHLVILCSLLDITPDYVEKYIELIITERNVTAESQNDYKLRLMDAITRRSKEELRSWITHQVYLALGVLLTTAASMNIDACPKEGFDAAAFNKILNLDKYGIESQVLYALGYRATDDWLAKLKKVRFPKEKIVVEL
jgi:nitroreductase